MTTIYEIWFRDATGKPSYLFKAQKLPGQGHSDLTYSFYDEADARQAIEHAYASHEAKIGGKPYPKPPSAGIGIPNAKRGRLAILKRPIGEKPVFLD